MLEPATHRPGTVLGGKFRIERLLGSGGMGAVYEVTHTVTRHRRALKLLHPRMAANEEVVERFLREASAAGRIGNPHIVETFDGGRLPSGEPYVLLELLEGRSLAELLKGTSGLGVAETLEIVAQACDGTEAANQAGIIHRDLKPDNLFVCERAGRPFVKLLDFGVSRFEPRTSIDRATTGGGLIGTPFYMAPEQMRGDLDLDARADVYALGVITWECLTHTLPYAARDVVRLVGEVLSEREPRLDQMRPDLPPALVDVVARAMKKDREQRFGSAEALGDALRALGATLGAAGSEPSALAATGLALAPTPADRASDPLGATLSAGTDSGPLRISTGADPVDEVALTALPIPASTPVVLSTPAPASAPRAEQAPAASERPSKLTASGVEVPPTSGTQPPVARPSRRRAPWALLGVVLLGGAAGTAAWLAASGGESAGRRAVQRAGAGVTTEPTATTSSTRAEVPDQPTSPPRAKESALASAEASPVSAVASGSAAPSISAAPRTTGSEPRPKLPSPKPSSPIAGKGEFPGG